MLRTVWLGLIAAILGGGVALAGAPPGDEAPRVTIDTGTLQGTQVDAANVFRAIPYAAPPIGPLRWRPPQPATSWSGVRPAATDGPACPQTVSADGHPNAGGYAGPTSEDCLTLDVFAPPHAAKAPVMVWIFGGGNVAGADSIAPNDGRFFARDGVILVAMNYRLGPLGFFAHPALTQEAGASGPLANYALMDQVAALQWVKRNIAAFGGDPDNVTVFGESAGGADVLTLMVTPAARGLFQKATVQSGGGWSAPVNLIQAEMAGDAMARGLGLPPNATAEQLRDLPVDKLVGLPLRIGPVVDGRWLSETAAQGFARGHQAPAPLIIGSNTWEASLLPAASYQAYDDATPAAVKAGYLDLAADPAGLAQAMFTDKTMGAPARWFAAKASAKAGAWLYEFSYVRVVRRGKIPGANHTSENPYVFDTQMIVPNYASEIVDQDRAVAAFMHTCWVAFAKTGKPACAAGGVAWPAYSPANDALMDFDSPPTIAPHYRKAQLDAQQAAAEASLAP